MAVANFGHITHVKKILYICELSNYTESTMRLDFSEWSQRL